VEARLTFRGEKKPLYFRRHRSRFHRFLPKITTVEIDRFPFNCTEQTAGKDKWGCEEYQRNAILRGLDSAADSDILILTDVDEILRFETVLALKHCAIKTPVFFTLTPHYFSFKWASAAHIKWPHPEAWTVSDLTYGGLGTSSISTLRALRHWKPEGLVHTDIGHAGYLGTLCILTELANTLCSVL
jgi:hypothetical protein